MFKGNIIELLVAIILFTLSNIFVLLAFNSNIILGIISLIFLSIHIWVNGCVILQYILQLFHKL